MSAAAAPGAAGPALPARARATTAVLVAVNLLPLWGVVFRGWPVLDLLALYWAENVILGGLNVLRMALAQPHGIGGLFQKPPSIAFFCFHYGLFCFAHGAILHAVFAPDGHGASDLDLALLVARLGEDPGLRLGVGLLAASHVTSFIVNGVAGGEVARTPLDHAMFLPYVRVVVLHVVILLGGFIAVKLGSPAPVVLMLVALKTWVDLRLHRREHRLPPPAPEPAP